MYLIITIPEPPFPPAALGEGLGEFGAVLTPPPPPPPVLSVPLCPAASALGLG